MKKHDKEEIYYATMSFIEEEGMDNYLQTSLGRIRRNSTLYNMLVESARTLGKEPSDETLRSVFLMLDNVREISRTVSATEKGFPQQYHSLDYFESSTVDFSAIYSNIREEILGAVPDPNRDISDLYLDYIEKIEKFKNSYMSNRENMLRQLIADRMSKDGIDTLSTRFKNSQNLPLNALR